MISISNEKGLLQRISIGPHTLHSDVSVELGGEGSAPEPHDLFDAALGACKALTLALYAKQRGLPLEGLDVKLNRDDSQERQGSYRLRVWHSHMAVGAPALDVPQRVGANGASASVTLKGLAP